MKMKEFGPPGGARVPGAPPWIRQWIYISFGAKQRAKHKSFEWTFSLE